MSNPLQVLLERITPVTEPLQEPKEPSRAQMRLITRVQRRQCQEYAIPITEERLEEAKNELKMIEHIFNCSECLIELQLSVERYLGRRGPWYIDKGVDFDDEIWGERPSYYKDCPRATDYELGWYGHSSEDTICFIKDRLKWAQKLYEQEVQVIQPHLEALKEWDLESPLPPDSVFYID